MDVNISKTGILNGLAIEPFITLADGSKWQLLLFHYVDKGNNLFTSSNATYCNDWGLYSRLKWIDEFIYNDLYEFYIIQDGVEHRFTQTSQPTATAYTGFTVISGNPVQGLCKSSNLNNTYIGYNAWWGACGCWTSYTLSGKKGIPGFGPHNANGICQNYLALYARIDTPHAFLEDGIENGGQIYEY